jgi:hypothetical protein
MVGMIDVPVYPELELADSILRSPLRFIEWPVVDGAKNNRSRPCKLLGKKLCTTARGGYFT